MNNPLIGVQQIRVDHCSATGPEYSNITPGSIHDRLPAPEGRHSSEVWVMGTTEPVRLTFWEYDLID